MDVAFYDFLNAYIWYMVAASYVPMVLYAFWIFFEIRCENKMQTKKQTTSFNKHYWPVCLLFSIPVLIVLALVFLST